MSYKKLPETDISYYKKCRNCGKLIAETTWSCPYCLESNESYKIGYKFYCSYCGYMNKHEVNYCERCCSPQNIPAADISQSVYYMDLLFCHFPKSASKVIVKHYFKLCSQKEKDIFKIYYPEWKNTFLNIHKDASDCNIISFLDDFLITTLK